MENLSSIIKILLLFTIPLLTHQQTLSSVDFTKNIEVLASPAQNMVGISMYIPELINYLTNPVFLTRVNSSKFYGDWSSLFYQSIHVGLGYKYNCNASLYGPAGTTIVCLKDLATNSTPAILQKYISKNTNYYGIDLGWDMEKSNFANTTYFNNLKAYMNIFYYDSINLQLLDEGDRMLELYNRTYTVANFESDISTIRSKYSGLYINGPGITENANSSWVARLPYICDTYYSTFTFKSILFKNQSEATIENLMSDYYSKGYLQRRLVNELGAIIDVQSYYVGISEIKQISGNGIHGVTNTFASALWALDITMEYAAMGGFFINFFNPLTPSNQSFFGAGPLFQPAPIYYGVLFAIWTLRNQPQIHKVPIVAGFSSNIKVYGLDDWWQTYRILILNKDTNPNASGVVVVKLNTTSGLRCSYLSAPSLSSTTNATFAGMSFMANATEMSGYFGFFDYKSTADGVYSVELNYSQAALCHPIEAQLYPNRLIRGDPRSMFNPQVLLSLLLIILMISI